jgi:hypothetical protein
MASRREFSEPVESTVAETRSVMGALATEAAARGALALLSEVRKGPIGATSEPGEVLPAMPWYALLLPLAQYVLDVRCRPILVDRQHPYAGIIRRADKSVRTGLVID